MKIKALGAVGTVTGSCFRLELDDGRQILLDCGLFQGGRQTELRNADTRVYNPGGLAAMVITHAHMDHSGLVPRLVKEGFSGPVFATEATCDLLKALWLDAANIQQQEAVWKSRKNRRQGKREVEPLYDEDDARLAMTKLTPLSMEDKHEILPGLTLVYRPAGHILGAASAHFTVSENGRSLTVAFSGDIGRTGQLLLPDPAIPPAADVIFMETTYGNRLHKEMGPSVDEFLAVVNQAYRENGKVLIPAFAVERTQEIMLLLARAWREGTIPKDIPIILDSPLALAATRIYARHTGLFDEETRNFLEQGASPASMPNLRITRDAQESQRLNDIKGSAVIIAGSGMANAGRILHHLKHNLWRPNCHVIFVGFQAQGTTGRRLVEGAKAVKIFREAVNVEARIHTIGGFSGHADQNELIAWLSRQARPGLTVNLVHGEPSSTRAFYELAKTRFPEVFFNIPTWLRYAELAAERPALAGEALDEAGAWPEGEGQTRSIRPSLMARLERLKDQAAGLGEMPPEQLALLEDYLAQAESLMLANAG
ncbi:MAG: MBL fold metallo-hydrolase [Candidatus Adiutrix sp.]|jgi:metallo-beta-lactamase family protein|nr:MBL fold metallo-hydrolase [Candidatus Adiutrix sp.]